MENVREGGREGRREGGRKGGSCVCKNDYCAHTVHLRSAQFNKL